MRISFIYPDYLWLLLLIPLTVGLAWFGPRSQSKLRRWGGLALRVLLLALIVLALAGIQLRLPADTLTAVFILDASDSIPPAERQRGEELVRQAVQAMPAGDRAAVVMFGENALVERLASGESALADLASTPISTRTDIGGAMQLALALLPNEGARRLVLLSDGRENLGQALEQAELAALQDVQMVYVPLGEENRGAEVRLENLEAPASARQGQEIELQVTVHSSQNTGASLRVFGDDRLVHTQEVLLQTGANHFTITLPADQTGFRRFRAQVIPDADNRLQNNEASAFTVVHGPPRILIVEGVPEEGENLSAALEAAGMEVTRLSPGNMPTTLLELAAFDSVILANVHAGALPDGAMEALPVFVRELGHGLVMTGGDQAFGAGGYLRSPLEDALPVDMDVKSKELQANLALVLAVDKSGSMGRCHCDNPDLNQTYTRAEVGQPKVDIAKEAVMRAASALGPQDYLGVVTFDSQAHWELEVQPLPDSSSLENAIGAFQATGQTNLQTGVEAAYAGLEGVNAKRKHIILMTDGWVHEGDMTQMVRRMQEQGITLSVVAAGEGSALYLSALALDGGGRFYPAQNILGVPDIFLKETVKSVGQYIVEEAFFPLPSQPSPILHGLDPATLPPLLGYNGATAKNTARLDLLTPRGDPLLASWQYGLGRSVVWTSDLKGQWGQGWVGWDGFPRFAAQLVNWTLPEPQVEGLQAEASLEGGQAAVRLQAVDSAGRPLNFLQVEATLIGPDLQTQSASLEQVGAGQYQAQLETNQPGAYLVRLGANDGDQSLGQTTLGLVVPYSPEYRDSGADFSLLERLAQATGGSQLLDPLSVFLHNLPAADYAREIWRPLLLIAALLFPLDVALRRLGLTRRDWQKAGAWVGERLPGRRTARAPQERALGQLFTARDRARRKQGTLRPDKDAPAPPTAGPPPPAGGPPEQEPPAPPPGETDSFQRLRQAKKRARKD